ncbi:sigma factor-like helix-turn-helix DNA-binding protein [Paenibacillus sp. NEAU-GSW1]|uniref:sigma factor-like helix-turn-helix DNA-binding protein n=1 Tax=Paenibacillus sp. NEAU-GSW1 TaxID=2682486 RepID=UPI0012E2ED6F|nr:sigma factor-like helix-turn-helix DNA-binding protein [Paenibacillus sp. NEAU-GSW1]MUT66024.1 hypothetical protein [Paenibacillus sp. NEAU-GSW1]
MRRENVTELLKNYRSYKYAINRYDRHKPGAAAGVASYDAMPSGSGASEYFFDLNARMADMGTTNNADYKDYLEYKRVVQDIEGGLDELTDEEQSVVRLKWMEDMSLRDIAKRKQYSVETVKRNHKRALEKLGICYRFIKVPQIEPVTLRGSEHYHHQENPNNRLTLL